MQSAPVVDPNRMSLSWKDVNNQAAKAANYISGNHKEAVVTIYPIPRGGIYAALLVCQELGRLKRPMAPMIVETVEQADYIVDDIYDSGETYQKTIEGKAAKPFVCLVDKRLPMFAGKWITMPWERMTGEDQGPQENVRRLLQFIEGRSDRDGILETPDRVIASYSQLFSGYDERPEDHFKTFDEPHDEMVILKDIEFYSTCEHHMLPFAGKAHIGYIPNGKVIGVSKLARILEVYARRLQIQERICRDVTSALDLHLQPLGSACVIEAVHFCIACRGVGKQHSKMVTSAMTGVFREVGSARSEFLSLIK
jgi:GTP cyclohydrolase I